MPHNLSLKHLFEKCLMFQTEKDKLETRPKEITHLPHLWPWCFTLKPIKYCLQINTVNCFTVAVSGQECRYKNYSGGVNMLIKLGFFDNILLLLPASIVRVLWNSWQNIKFNSEIHINLQTFKAKLSNKVTHTTYQAVFKYKAIPKKSPSAQA